MRWSEAGDGALLAATRREPAAFMAFYERYESAVIGYFLRRTRDVEVSVDLASETFASALAAASRFRVPGARNAAAARDATAAPWLFTIAANVLRDSLRRGRVQAAARQRMGIREPVSYEDDELERIESRVGGWGESEAELAARLLAGLPADQREAVWARVVDEREYGEIAGRLGTSELVVRQRVSRALRRLRHQIEEERAT